MTPTDPGRLSASHPELFAAPFAGRLPFRTLGELQLRFADDARDRGLVLVRAPRVVKGRTLPGLWLDPVDWPQVEALLPEVERFRARRDALREASFHVDGAAPQATEARHDTATLQGGAPGPVDGVEADPAAVAERASELVAQWAPTRPEWYAASALQAWALGVASTGRHAEHPLQHLGAVRDLLADDPVVGNAEFLGAEVRAKVARADVLEELWATPALAHGTPKAQVRAAIAAVGRRPLEAAAAEFVAGHPLTDVDPELEYSPDEWRTALLRAYVAAIDWKWKPHKTAHRAESRLAEELSLRRLELTARRARRDLPERLKDFYPRARAMRRRITFLRGPTNSGKTHRALEALKAAPTGAYLGPLRLLALEVYERLNADGVATSLVTGELIEEVAGARHVAATVEMLDVSTAVDVAVIDEIQMLADPDRGTAWLHAMLGAPARHLVLVGSPAALPAVRALAAVTGEPLEEIVLERLNPLQVLERPSRLSALEPGTAVIVFSRQAALSLARHLRAEHRRRVSVIYGALSPEVRREQARQFREGETEIVVATDAIGMGLNLPIRTLLFTTHIKWNGESEEPVSRSLTWQIAGRAGRYGLHEAGFVGALQPEALEHVREMLDEAPAEVEFPLAYGLTLPVAEAIARQLETTELALVLQFFATRLELEDWAVPQASRDEAELASYLGGSGLTLATQLTLSRAPATQRDEINPWFGQMVRALIDDDPGHVGLLDAPPPSNDLEALEQRVRDLTLYCWMHYRWPPLFPHVARAQRTLQQLNARIIRELERHPGRRCASCDRPMRWDSPHGRCEQCFRGRRAAGRSRV